MPSRHPTKVAMPNRSRVALGAHLTVKVAARPVVKGTQRGDRDEPDDRDDRDDPDEAVGCFPGKP
jgi:hypothetical protein